MESLLGQIFYRAMPDLSKTFISHPAKSNEHP